MKIVLPILAAAAVLLALVFTPSPVSAAACGSTYTVQPGDTMWGIAVRCGVNLSDLINANPAFSNPSLIFVGQTLNIPQTSSVPVTGGTTTGRYTVVDGDTLTSIALRAGVSLQALEDANPFIANFNLIFPGQVILLPSGASVPVTGSNGSTTTTPSGKTYTVKSGDTLTSIAAQFGTSVPALVAKNGIQDPNTIFVGEVLSIP